MNWWEHKYQSRREVMPLLDKVKDLHKQDTGDALQWLGVIFT